MQNLARRWHVRCCLARDEGPTIYGKISRWHIIRRYSGRVEPAMAWLVLNHDGADLVAHKLLGQVITIGRVPLNHLVIDNPTISAQHAILARLGDCYRLKDLQSTNGTQVNGAPITDAELNDGDKIRFGSVVAVFVGPVT